MTLPELIDRLERATEGSRDLDRLIWPVVSESAVTTVEPYTRSIDAALTLVPEGAGIQMIRDYRSRHFYVHVFANPDIARGAVAPTFPLAISLAAMKARLAMEGGNG